MISVCAFIDESTSTYGILWGNIDLMIVNVGNWLRQRGILSLYLFILIVDEVTDQIMLIVM